MNKRLEPKIWNKISYVEFIDIEKFHGKEWYEQWSKAFGLGNTCPIIEDNKTDTFGCCYYHDYKRFADVVDFNNPTYWD